MSAENGDLIMTNTLPAYLPISDDMALLLRVIHSEGAIPEWATKPMLGRARNRRLLAEVSGGLALTPTGEALAVITDAHSYHTGYNHTGKIGTKGRCRCRNWAWSTNEKGHDGKRRVREAFMAHLADLVNEYLAETQ